MQSRPRRTNLVSAHGNRTQTRQDVRVRLHGDARVDALDILRRDVVGGHVSMKHLERTRQLERATFVRDGIYIERRIGIEQHVHRRRQSQTHALCAVRGERPFQMSAACASCSQRLSFKRSPVGSACRDCELQHCARLTGGYRERAYG